MKMEDLRICIVGGIFSKPIEYQQKLLFTPETVLANNLKQRGCIVDKKSPYDLIDSEKYDVIHFHHVSRKALHNVVSCQNTAVIFTGHGSMYYERKNLFRAIAKSNLLKLYLNDVKMRLALRYILKKSDAIVTLYASEFKQVERIIGVQDSSKIFLIPNGIPDEFFYPKGRSDNGIKKLLFVGQLTEEKGINVLLNALPQIHSKMNVELLLAYQINKLETSTKKIVDHFGLSDNVKYLGFLSTKELANLYSDVDLVVLPSYSEALPSVLTEALLCGTPVVASDVGGIKEQINGYGILVQPGNVKQLSEAIIFALDKFANYDFEQRLRMHKFASKKFNVESMITKHLEMYQQSCEKKSDSKKVISIMDKLLSKFTNQEVENVR